MVTFYIGARVAASGFLFSLPSDWSVYRSEIDPISIVRVACDPLQSAEVGRTL